MAVVDVFNRALSACGVELGITDPDENSREAALCRLWYPIVRDNVQSAARWPSLRRYARLALAKERDFDEDWVSSDPAPSFRYRYAAPADLLLPYHLSTYERFEYFSRLISTNEPEAILYYNAKVENPAQWETGLELAVIHTLATYLAIPLTGRSSRLEENAQLAFVRIEEAQTLAANAENDYAETLPDWIQARGYANPTIEKYFYPLRELKLGVTK
jgi:hypothetical protein